MNHRLIVSYLVLITLTACKTRAWEDSGLLDQYDGPVEQVAEGGKWNVRCVPQEESESQSFELDVKGAVSLVDEGQPISVSVMRRLPEGDTEMLVKDERGRGAISSDLIFLGFLSGALTAEEVSSDAPQPDGASGVSAADGQPRGETWDYAGLLSIAGNNGVGGLDVRCTATAVSAINPEVPQEPLSESSSSK